MTRKHFKALAQELRNVRPEIEVGPRGGTDHLARVRLVAWEACVEAVGTACARSNPAFDRGRFNEACGY